MTRRSMYYFCRAFTGLSLFNLSDSATILAVKYMVPVGPSLLAREFVACRLSSCALAPRPGTDPALAAACLTAPPRTRTPPPIPGARRAPPFRTRGQGAPRTADEVSAHGGRGLGPRRTRSLPPWPAEVSRRRRSRSTPRSSRDPGRRGRGSTRAVVEVFAAAAVVVAMATTAAGRWPLPWLPRSRPGRDQARGGVRGHGTGRGRAAS